MDFYILRRDVLNSKSLLQNDVQKRSGKSVNSLYLV